ncbi:MAG: Hint domain-containing protein [Pseudomonadota bacterium]
MAQCAHKVSDETASLLTSDAHVICFVRGTAIRTPDGDRAIETLREGDPVITIDSGAQPIRWIGQTTMRASGKLAPVRFAKGVLGNYRDLLVSPRHRVLMPGAAEALVPAQNMIDDFGVTVRYGGMVTYIHVLFDQHEMLIANGAASESFYPENRALETIPPASREDLFAQFPTLRADLSAYGPVCRNTTELTPALTM